MKEHWIHSIEVGFLIALLLTPQLSWAQSEEARAKQLFKEGQTAYDLAEFDKALGLYSEAYRLKPLPGFLFNMAQCHRQKGNYERAAFFFQRFIDNSAAKAPNLDVAKELLAEMRAKQAEKGEKPDGELKKPDAKAAAPTPAPPTGFAELKVPTLEPVATPAAKPNPISDAPIAAAPKSLEPPVKPTPAPVLTQGPPPEKPVYLKGWFWGVIGLGVAAVVGGLVTVAVVTTPKPRPTTLGDIGSNK